MFGWGWALWVWIAVSLYILGMSYRQFKFGRETQGHLPVMLLFGFVLFWVLPKLQIGGPNGGGVPIRGFGVMLLVAVLSAVALASKRAKQLRFNPELIYALAVWVFISGILGARVFYVVQKWKQFGGGSLVELLAGIVNVTQGGIVIYGGLIGGAIGFFVFVVKNRLSWLAVGDLIAPSVLLGMAIGRIGCFLNGCCYGGECEAAWAVRFPPEAPPYVDQLRSGDFHGVQLVETAQGQVQVASLDQELGGAATGLKVGDVIVAIGGQEIRRLSSEGDRSPGVVAADLLQIARPRVELQTNEGKQYEWSVELPARSRPLHPTQIYSTMNALLICIFLLAYFPFQKRDGESIVLFMVLYAISRFLLEIIRNDEFGFLGSLTISQSVSIGVLLAALALGIYVLRCAPGRAWGSAILAT